MARRIYRALSERNAMNIDELHRHTGLDKQSLLTELQTMLRCGDVELLRPVDCVREDYDYFRIVPLSGEVARYAEVRGLSSVNTRIERLRFASDATMCFAE